MIEANLQRTLTHFDLDVSISALDGITAIFGPSGCGKTTILRCLAGLNQATGFVKVGETVWQDHTTFMPPHQRPIGYVFQDARLFPHLSVNANLEFASKRAVDEPVITFDALVDLLNIRHCLKQMPNTLSGGEQQRVAIARALLIAPKLLLMDEPLANLDQAHKQEILPYLEKIKNESSLPIIYVSHSLDEVTRLADQVFTMQEGKVISSGAVADVLSQLKLVGSNDEHRQVVLNCKVEELLKPWNLTKLAFEGGQLIVSNCNFNQGQLVRVCIMARDVSLSLQAPINSSILNCLPAVIDSFVVSDDESFVLIRIRVGEQFLLSRITRLSLSQLRLQPGDKVWAQVKSAALLR